MHIKIKDRLIGLAYPTYLIADIAANHNGDIKRAKKLIYLAKEAGADAVKFQNFQVEKIVSKEGFENLGKQSSHQKLWKKAVFDVYKDASLSWDWTPELKACCDEAGIHYLSTPYDLEAVDMLDKYVPAFKIGSGDITWLTIIESISKKKKPVLLATGASDIGDVQKAADLILKNNNQLVLMQCNTNYTSSEENFKYIQLNVLKTYNAMYPEVILGLSDHTAGHATALGAVALGARVIEKHFTDDTSREGPDHKFSMDPQTWKEMTKNVRQLEYSLGTGNKVVEYNEKETVILQRRSVHAIKNIMKGELISNENIFPLRPAKPESIKPYDYESILGSVARREIKKGEALTYNDVENVK